MASSNHEKFPPFIYGTAWKEDSTADFVNMAVSTGFSGIDTANQPRHYQEQLVGEALLKLSDSGINREKLFIQSKFTPVDGHDHRIPYDPYADLTTQVKQSFESSLKNLHTDFIDSYLLHGPYNQPGLGNEDWEVWKTIEKLYKTGKTRFIGISNVNIQQLKLLVEKAEIKPMIVQNRCFANLGWDREVREFCNSNHIVYEGFSLLTANPFVLHNPEVMKTARELGMTPEQIAFRFAIHLGILPLTGTTSQEHMKEDLQAIDIELNIEYLNMIGNITS